MLYTPTFNPKPKPQKKLKVKKRKKKTERQLWEHRLDSIVREIILLRDERCVCPAPEKGHTQALQAGHIITRGRESTKWDLMNVHCQCSGCNLRHVHRPEIYTDWFLRKFGEDEYIRMVERSVTVRKYTIDELEKMHFNFTEILRLNLKEYFYAKQDEVLDMKG